MMTDPIADMLTRIRNAQSAGKSEVVLPTSKMKLAVAQVLERENWVGKVEKQAGNFSKLKIKLKYDQNKQPVISNLQKISKPGRRVYVKKNNLPRVLNNLGIAIISTPQGLMTNKEAKKLGLGGEVICEVY